MADHETVTVEHVGSLLLRSKFSGTQAITDSQGQFSLSNPPLPCTVLIFDPSGYFEERRTATDFPLQIKLRSVGTLQGRLLIGSRATPGERIEVHTALLPYIAFPRTFPALWFRAHTEADASGAFVLSNLPPVALEVGHAVRFPGLTNDFLTSQNTRIAIPEGDACNITLGGNGRSIVGRIELENFEGALNWPVQSQMISAVVPRPPALVQIDKQVAEFNSKAKDAKTNRNNPLITKAPQLGSTIESAVRAFYRSSEGRSYHPRRLYTLTFSHNGSFRAEDLPPGDYNLELVLRERPPIPGIPAPQLASLQQTITVPANESSEPFDLGTIRVAPHITALQIGSTAPGFAVNDFDGKPFKLSDFKGKFVLLEFWAVWCAPCKAEIPHLKEIYDAFKSDDRFVMISLSLDESAQIARDFVNEQSLLWKQGYLGEWPPGPVANSYKVLGPPYLYLIDPDGKILANRLRGSNTKKAVSAALSWQSAKPSDQN